MNEILDSGSSIIKQIYYNTLRSRDFKIQHIGDRSSIKALQITQVLVKKIDFCTVHSLNL